MSHHEDIPASKTSAKLHVCWTCCLLHLGWPGNGQAPAHPRAAASWDPMTAAEVDTLLLIGRRQAVGRSLSLPSFICLPFI
jgi:hypothetical protein